MPTALVVDDSNLDRVLIGRLLASLDIAAESAADGEEALAKMAAALPDLVVTDLVMPGMDGLELVAEVKKRYPLVPVVIVTAEGNEKMAVQALRQGAASYVPKRTLSDDLLDTVEQVLAAALQERRRSELMKTMTRCQSSFALANDRVLLPPLVSYILEHVANLGLCDEAELTRVGVALEEALANAAEHGNLELDSELRESDRAAYDALADKRRRQAPYCERRVYLDTRLSLDEAVFVVRDEGRGFDPATLPDPTDAENLLKASGRGVMLMRTFMDEVIFERDGRQVTMIKRRSVGQSADAASPNTEQE